MKSFPLPWLGAIALSFFAFGTTIKAQTATTPSETTPQHHPRFFEQLGLTDAQKAQLKQIRRDTAKGKARREAMMAVLTPEQKAQLKQDIEQCKATHQ